MVVEVIFRFFIVIGVVVDGVMVMLIGVRLVCRLVRLMNLKLVSDSLLFNVCSMC